MSVIKLEIKPNINLIIRWSILLAKYDLKERPDLDKEFNKLSKLEKDSIWAYILLKLSI